MHVSRDVCGFESNEQLISGMMPLSSLSFQSNFTIVVSPKRSMNISGTGNQSEETKSPPTSGNQVRA